MLNQQVVALPEAKASGSRWTPPALNPTLASPTLALPTSAPRATPDPHSLDESPGSYAEREKPVPRGDTLCDSFIEHF